jgi:hypothetical protein
VKSTTSALSFEKGAGVVNQNQHHPLDTSADAATAMTDSLVLTQGRTNQLVLDPLSIPHHAPPPPHPLPHLAMSNNSLPRQPISIHSPMWLDVFSFSNRIMFSVTPSLICGEFPTTRAQYMCS